MCIISSKDDFSIQFKNNILFQKIILLCRVKSNDLHHMLFTIIHSQNRTNETQHDYSKLFDFKGKH